METVVRISTVEKQNCSQIRSLSPAHPFFTTLILFYKKGRDNRGRRSHVTPPFWQRLALECETVHSIPARDPLGARVSLEALGRPSCRETVTYKETPSPSTLHTSGPVRRRWYWPVSLCSGSQCKALCHSCAGVYRSQCHAEVLACEGLNMLSVTDRRFGCKTGSLVLRWSPRWKLKLHLKMPLMSIQPQALQFSILNKRMKRKRRPANSKAATGPQQPPTPKPPHIAWRLQI